MYNEDSFTVQPGGPLFMHVNEASRSIDAAVEQGGSKRPESPAME